MAGRCGREWIRMAFMSVEYVPAPIVQLRRALFLTFTTVAFFAPATPAPAQQALDPMQAPGLATPSSQDAHAIAQHTNRLITETSPYLLLHAHNPVDWYPWGKEAFEKARSEHKPVFLSIGHYPCHCRPVMERE